MKAYPLLFWTGIWLPIFLVILTATNNLLNPDLSQRQTQAAIAPDAPPATQIPASTPPPTFAKTPIETGDGQMPIWLFGAIAFSCVVGSMVISKQIKPDAAPIDQDARQPNFRPGELRSRSFLAAAVASAGRRPQRQPKRLDMYAAAEPFPLAAAQSSDPYTAKPGSHIPVFPIGQAQSIAFQTASPPVHTGNGEQIGDLDRTGDRNLASIRDTVIRDAVNPVEPTAIVPSMIVPSEQSHPLDWGEARLADSVDLRRRRSIESWM